MIYDLVKNLLTGTPRLSEIRGLAWRCGSRSVCNGVKSETVADLDEIPTPDFADWFASLESNLRESNREAIRLPIETSRGCWFGERRQCTFCGLNGSTLRFRQKSPSKACELIADAASYGVTELYAVDSIIPQSYVRELPPLMEKSGLGEKLNIHYEVMPNLGKRQMKELRDAGVRRMQPGIESFSSPVLRLMRKGTRSFQNIRFLKWGAELGINLLWHLLYGLPGEEASEYRRMIDMIPLLFHLQPPINGCSRVRMYRFSPLFRDYRRMGIRDVRPAHAYTLLYDLTEDEIGEYAFQFDFDMSSDAGLEDGHRILREIVRGWHRAVGTASLTGISTDVGLRIFDRRSDSEELEYRLCGAEEKIYRACDSGMTTQAIQHRLGLPRREVDRVTSDLIRRGLMLGIDGRFLSLAVMVDEWIQESVPPSILGDVCHAIHTSRMRLMTRRASASDPEAC